MITLVSKLMTFVSLDIYTIDEQLSATLRTYLQTLFSVLSTVVVISGVTPLFALCLMPIIAFYVVEQKFFTVRNTPYILDVSFHPAYNPLLSFTQLTYRELKRLESEIIDKVHDKFGARARAEIGVMSGLKLKQFHGIDTSHFAVELAKTTLLLWSLSSSSLSASLWSRSSSSFLSCPPIPAS